MVETGLLEACAVEHFARYALGRELRRADRELSDILVERFGAAGGHFGELLLAIVSDETFGFRREEPKH